MSQEQHVSEQQTTGGGALVEQLIREGVTTLFGIPGVQTYGVFDALHKNQDKIKLVNPRHEQGCSHMAFGAARSTGQPAVFSVVPGPGILNAGTGILDAYGCNEPILCLTGQVPTPFLDKGRMHLHEMPDQLATLKTITKHAARVTDVASAPQAVAEAFQAMRTPRRGPAAIEMPWDVIDSAGTAATVEPLAALPTPEPVAGDVTRAAELLSHAKRPMIFVGSGALEAQAQVKELAERLGAPVVAFRSGRGIVADDDPLGVTIVSGRTLFDSADAMVAIGTRLELTDWRWGWQPEGITSIRIDVDPAEATRRDSTVDITASAVAGTAALIAELEGRSLQGVDQRADIAAAKADADQRIRKIQPQLDYLDVLRDVLPRDAIFCDEATQVGFASWYGLPIYEPRTFVTSGCQGTLGSGFLTALGAKVANPDKAVVSITGDGGFLFGMQDLATAVEHRIGVVTIVFNNGVYGNVMRDQDLRFESRQIGVDLGTPDLLKVADAFGMAAARVNDAPGLRTAVAKAVESGDPWLIDVTVPRGTETSPWEFIHPAPTA